MERKNYKISREVFKFPYNGNCENNDNEMLTMVVLHMLEVMERELVQEA